MGTKKPVSKPALQPLRQLVHSLSDGLHGIKGRGAVAIRKEIEGIYLELGRIAEALDPIRNPSSVFDPSNPSTVGQFIGLAMVAQDRFPLATVPAFYGSGVYALYYKGSYRNYQPISGTETPIYVGKADPAAPSAKTPREQQQRLWRRLRDHARSVRKAVSTLSLDDFTCRFLVVQSGWQTPAEDYLIELFKPVWNDEINIAFGVGKHGDDPGTRANLRSPWDTLHPGRPWAHRGTAIRDAVAKELIVEQLADHFEINRPLRSIDDVLKRFYLDLKQS